MRNLRVFGFFAWRKKAFSWGKKVVGAGGLEPPTNGLKGRCSTIELHSQPLRKEIRRPRSVTIKAAQSRIFRVFSFAQAFPSPCPILRKKERMPPFQIHHSSLEVWHFILRRPKYILCGCVYGLVCWAALDLPDRYWLKWSHWRCMGVPGKG